MTDKFASIAADIQESGESIHAWARRVHDGYLLRDGQHISSAEYYALLNRLTGSHGVSATTRLKNKARAAADRHG
ncbi:MAG: hypothetical protein JXQ91_13285 [Vannielia sp.]|uniref:hypothetical protein n=1 Tax=Vannielia sp. TaxID=2813045 RepID=UPI003B8E42EC